MTNRIVCFLAIFVSFSLLVGCESESDSLCEPGATQACVCFSGAEGAQICAADGQRWEACQCESDGDADIDDDSGEEDIEDGDGDIESEAGEADDDSEEDGEAQTFRRFNVHTEVLNPAFGSSSPVAVDLPRFDTEGNAYTLDSVDLVYSLLSDTRLEVSANPTDDILRKETAFTYDWGAWNGENQMLPDHETLHSGSFFVGYEANALEEAGTHLIQGIGVSNAETVTDAEFLAALTGVSPLSLEGIFNLSTATDQIPPNIDSYGVWDPDLYEVFIDRLYVDIEITYNYSVK
jgi:hypothetical protein